jgi:hypothetical protein
LQVIPLPDLFGLIYESYLGVLAKSRLDLPTFENPTVQAKLDRAEGYFSSAWSILENVSAVLSIVVELWSQTAVMIQVIKSRQDSWLFFGISMARSLVSQVFWSFQGTCAFFFLHSCHIF